MSNLVRGNKPSVKTPTSKRVEVTGRNPFADKRLPDGKKLFKREHGVTGQVQNVPVTISFSIPYNACKITRIEIIGGVVGDTVNFKVYDTPDGLIQQSMGVPAGEVDPHLLLNQFGFNVNVAKDYHMKDSEYDADLIKNMVLEVEYDAKDELLPRTIGINFILHEVK